MIMIPSSTTTDEVVTTTTNNKSNTNNNKKRKQRGSYYQQHIIYDHVYTALKGISTKIIPLSINRITSAKTVKLFLVKHGLVEEVKSDDNLKAEYLIYRYYTISPKGVLFINRYESFKELFTIKNE